MNDLKPRSNATQGQEPNHGRPQGQRSSCWSSGATASSKPHVGLAVAESNQEPQSSSSSYRLHGQYYQQPYYRTNPRTYNVEYVPGYTAPRNRWIQKYNGDWLDLLPQTPGQSIYFYEPRNQRRRNELDLYGYPSVSAPNYGQTAIACSFDFCLRTHTFHSRTQAERFLCKK